MKKGKKSEQEKAYYRVMILGKNFRVHRLQGMVFDQQGLLDAIHDSLIEKGYVFISNKNDEIYEKMEEDNRNFVPKKKSKCFLNKGQSAHKTHSKTQKNAKSPRNFCNLN